MMGCEGIFGNKIVYDYERKSVESRRDIRFSRMFA